MSNGDVSYVKSTVLAVFPEVVIIEVGSQINDDSVREAVAMYDLVQKVEDSVSLGTSDGFDFNPFGELVYGYEYSIEPSWRSWEWTDHVEPPACKGPCWRYCYELVGRDMLLLGEVLTALASLD